MALDGWAPLAQVLMTHRSFVSVNKSWNGLSHTAQDGARPVNLTQRFSCYAPLTLNFAAPPPGGGTPWLPRGYQAGPGARWCAAASALSRSWTTNIRERNKQTSQTKQCSETGLRVVWPTGSTVWMKFPGECHVEFFPFLCLEGNC